MAGGALGYCRAMSASHSDDPQRAAVSDETIREPENSTVDNWLGQRVQRDEERVDRLLEDSGGDVEEAEQRFNEESPEAEEFHAEHDQGDAGTRR